MDMMIDTCNITVLTLDLGHQVVFVAMHYVFSGYKDIQQISGNKSIIDKEYVC